MTYISMSQKDLNKYELIQRSIRQEITVKKTGQLLNLSERQIYRLKVKVKEKGVQGLIHGNKGQLSNRRMSEVERQKIIKLLRWRYADFKPTHASEKLAEVHNIKKDPKTIRQIMITEGLWKSRRKKKYQYRCARPRKEHYGEMEQFDGSYHLWFENRTPECCLLASIDDATSLVTFAKFVKDEGTLPVFGFFKEYFLTHGKPRSIYLDKLRTYYNNLKPALENEEMLTQFQRAMRELNVKPIVAHSPQAKGRIERLFKTFQDRLVKELRLKNISDFETANHFLKQEFIPWFNSRYSLEPVKTANLHKRLNQQEKKRLSAILSRYSQRTVQNDFTFRFNNQWYQLAKEQSATIRPKDRILIEERIDDQVYVCLRGKYLNYRILATKPRKEKKQPWVIAASQKKTKPYKPPINHPWRRPFVFKKPDVSFSLKP